MQKIGTSKFYELEEKPAPKIVFDDELMDFLVDKGMRHSDVP